MLFGTGELQHHGIRDPKFVFWFGLVFLQGLNMWCFRKLWLFLCRFLLIVIWSTSACLCFCQLLVLIIGLILQFCFPLFWILGSNLLAFCWNYWSCIKTNDYLWQEWKFPKTFNFAKLKGCFYLMNFTYTYSI